MPTLSLHRKGTNNSSDSPSSNTPAASSLSQLLGLFPVDTSLIHGDGALSQSEQAESCLRSLHDILYRIAETLSENCSALYGCLNTFNISKPDHTTSITDTVSGIREAIDIIDTRQLWNDSKIMRDNQELERLREESRSYRSVVNSWMRKHGEQEYLVSQVTAKQKATERHLQELKEEYEKSVLDNVDNTSALRELEAIKLSTAYRIASDISAISEFGASILSSVLSGISYMVSSRDHAAMKEPSGNSPVDDQVTM